MGRCDAAVDVGYGCQSAAMILLTIGEATVGGHHLRACVHGRAVEPKPCIPWCRRGRLPVWGVGGTGYPPDMVVHKVHAQSCTLRKEAHRGICSLNGSRDQLCLMRVEAATYRHARLFYAFQTTMRNAWTSEMQIRRETSLDHQPDASRPAGGPVTVPARRRVD